MPKFYSPETHSELAAKTWDAIVIGSGLGGLTTASLLARAGKKTLVLERHTVAGGFTHTFKRKGFEWDVGVHYVGQVGDPKSILRKFFDYVSEKKLEWDPMGEIYDQVFIAGDRYDFVDDLEKQIRLLVEKFPNEEKAIRSYYQHIKSVAGSSAWFFGEKSMPPWMSRTIGWLLRRSFTRAARLTTYEVLRQLTSDERLIAVLCAQCGDYGLSPKASSFGIHAIVVEHYLKGGSYPRGGARRIHETLSAVLENHGGRLVLKAEVEEILLEQGRAVGVRLKGGQTLRGRSIVSGAGVRNTFTRLLPRIPVLKPSFDPVAALQEIAPSSSHVCLYVGLNASDAELRLPKHNIWIYDRYDFDAAFAASLADPELAPPLLYLSFPSAKDSTWSATHPNQSTIQVIAGYPYAHVAAWDKSVYGKRGPEYLAFKARMAERLLTALEKALPQIKGHVSVAELSTPLSTHHFMNYGQGEIYGLAHTPARFALKWLRPQTPVRGLYLTGQDVVTVGVGGALAAGLFTAARVLDRFIFARIFRDRPL